MEKQGKRTAMIGAAERTPEVTDNITHKIQNARVSDSSNLVAEINLICQDRMPQSWPKLEGE